MNELWLVYSLVYYESKLEKSMPNVSLNFLMKSVIINIYIQYKIILINKNTLN